VEDVSAGLRGELPFADGGLATQTSVHDHQNGACIVGRRGPWASNALRLQSLTCCGCNPVAVIRRVYESATNPQGCGPASAAQKTLDNVHNQVVLLLHQYDVAANAGVTVAIRRWR